MPPVGCKQKAERKGICAMSDNEDSAVNRTDGRFGIFAGRTINGGISKTLRRAFILTAISALVILVAVFVFSRVGAEMIFRVGVRLTSVKVDISDAARLEYYDMKPYIPETEAVRFFMSGNIGIETDEYDAAFDLLSFLKQQDAEILTIRFPEGNEETMRAYLEGETADAPDGAAKDFLISLKKLNERLPPKKRLSVRVGSPGGDMLANREFVLTFEKYDASAKIDGVIDVACFRAGEDGCDPLFSVRTDSLRFGSMSALDSYSEYLYRVSGNFGGEAVFEINEPEFYFLFPSNIASSAENS